MEDVVSLESLRRLPPGGTIDPSALELVREWSANHQDSFAGLVISGDTVFVGVTSNPHEHLRSLRQLAPTVSLRVFQAKHAYTRLLDLVAEISTDLAALQSQGIEVVGVGIADNQNRVVLNLVRNESTWVETLRSRYGEDLVAFRITGRFQALHGGASS